MINRVILVGRITKDPEIRYTQSGIPSLNFTIATDKPHKDAQGERQADFINCVAWKSNAEFICRFIKKGYLMSVEGRLQSRSYQSPQDNITRYVTEVVVENAYNLQPRDPNMPTQGQFQPNPNNSFQNNNPFAQPKPANQPTFNPFANNNQGFSNPNYQQNPGGFNNTPPRVSPSTTSVSISDPEPESTIPNTVADDDFPF